MSAAAKIRSDFDAKQAKKSLPYFDILKLKGKSSLVGADGRISTGEGSSGETRGSSSSNDAVSNSLSYDHITTRDVVKAFRRESLACHPDKPKGDPKRFQEVNRAYQCLKDAEKRSRYIQFGFDEDNVGSGSHDTDDFIDAFFGETARAVDGLSADWKLHCIGNYLLLDPMAEDFPMYLRDIVRIGLNYLASLDFVRFENVFFLRHARVDCLYLMLGIIEGTEEWQKQQRRMQKKNVMGKLEYFNPTGTSATDLKGGNVNEEHPNRGLTSKVDNVIIEGQQNLSKKFLMDKTRMDNITDGSQNSDLEDTLDDSPFYLTQDIFESEYSYSITYYDTPLQPGIAARWSDQNVIGLNKEKFLGQNFDKQRERRELNFEEFERRTKYALAMLEDESQRTGVDELLRLEEQHYTQKLENMKDEHSKTADTKTADTKSEANSYKNKGKVDMYQEDVEADWQ